MLTIKTKLVQLPVKGIGVTAAQDIKAGDVIYEHNDKFAEIFTPEDMQALPELQQEFVKKHATKYGDNYFLDTDDTRFLNHSETPNMEFIGPDHHKAIALADIKVGEEITVSYKSLDPRCMVEYPETPKEGIEKYIPWQCCPKCNGQGTVAKPPHVPGDVAQWSSTSMTHQCDVCHGTKIIPMALVK